MDSEPIQPRPRTVDTEEYVRARIEQIAELLEVVDNPALGLGEVTSGPRTLFQRLPRHMRRRAMSHNVKRLPRALRPIAARHTQRTAHRKKAPSRKWRRRPTRLLKRWVREQRKSIWLETHIWHAKRFHMADLWGYKLPLRSCQRGFRPNYRCAVRSAVAFDQSYLCCLQFVVSAPIGTECKVKMISETLAPFCQKKVSPTFAHFGALSGHQEVPVMLFSPGKYPNGFLGPGRAMWTDDGRLLLWIHPSMECQLMGEMAKLSQISVISSAKINQVEKGDAKLGEEGKNAQIKLVNLRNRLCRFHLIGPKAIEFLRKVIRVTKEGKEGAENGDDFSTKFREMHRWWCNLPASVLPGNLRDGQIVSLLVEDPRLFRAVPTPKQQQQKQQQQSDHRLPLPFLRPPPTTLFADWQFFHQNLFPKRLSHSEFESFCADKLARPKRTEFKIPILLIFRQISVPSSAKNTVLHCVDLICPSGVGYDFWLALQFARFRPIGLHDKRAMDFEAGIGTFPDDFADCSAGRMAAQMEAKHLMEKYERRPHNRRVPFGEEGKKGKAHPFTFQWDKVLSEWNENTHGAKGSANNENNKLLPFSVLRDRQALKRLDLWFVSRQNANKKGDTDGTTPMPSPPILKEHFDAAFSVSPCASSALLVPVFVRMMRRGVPKRLSLITLPTDQDMQMLRGQGTITTTSTMVANGTRRIVIREEEQQQGKFDTAVDAEGNEKERKVLPCSSSPPLMISSGACHIPEFISLHDHQQQQQEWAAIAHFFTTDETWDEQLLSLEAMFPDGVDDKERKRKARNVNKRAKKRAKITEKRKKQGEREEEGKAMETENGGEQRREENSSTTRKLIGRVVRGDYAFGNAQGMALGFVPLNALAAIARTEGIVLVRGTTSNNCHPAKLHIHLVEQSGI